NLSKEDSLLASKPDSVGGVKQDSLVGSKRALHIHSKRDSLNDPKGHREKFKETGQSTVPSDLLSSSVKTHPNRRMIFPKTYLHIYNLGRSLQRYEYPPERWLRFFRPNNHIVDSIASFLVKTAGEPPVIIDSVQL